jgi:hypothetical protein
VAGLVGGLERRRAVVEPAAVEGALSVGVGKAGEAVRAHTVCPFHLGGELLRRDRGRLVPARQQRPAFMVGGRERRAVAVEVTSRAPVYLEGEATPGLPVGSGKSGTPWPRMQRA